MPDVAFFFFSDINCPAHFCETSAQLSHLKETFTLQHQPARLMYSETVLNKGWPFGFSTSLAAQNACVK